VHSIWVTSKIRFLHSGKEILQNPLINDMNSASLTFKNLRIISSSHFHTGFPPKLLHFPLNLVRIQADPKIAVDIVQSEVKFHFQQLIADKKYLYLCRLKIHGLRLTFNFKL